MSSRKVKTLGALSEFETILLLTEILNLYLPYLAGSANEVNMPLKKISAKEVESVEYLAGYCFRKTYFKLRSSRTKHLEATEQSLAIINAAKTDEPKFFVDLKNNTGLWKVNRHATALLRQIEMVFRKQARLSLHSVNADEIIEISMVNPVVKSCMTSMYRLIRH